MAIQYREAGAILDRLASGNGSLRALLYSKNNKAPIPILYAILTETLKYKKLLDQVIDGSLLLKENKFLAGRGQMIHVMVYDLLFGKGIQGGGQLKRLLTSYKTRMDSFLVRLKVKAKVSDVNDLIPQNLRTSITLPRYVRVNELYTDVATVVKQFEQQGYTMITADSADAEILRSRVVNTITNRENKTKEAKKKVMMIDKDIGSFLVFPPMTDLHDNALLKAGHIILQDKASAMSAYAMGQLPPNSHVLDACAAPGLKTQVLSQLMGNKGSLTALDRDPKRFDTLKRLAKKHNMQNLRALNMSFLDVDPLNPEFSKVEYILLDPSCSGSGIVNRMDYLIDSIVPDYEDGGDEALTEQERLNKLADFQITAIQHAFTFPNLKRLIYSTCSVHKIENEEVVKLALEAGKGKFDLDKNLFPDWKTRGLDEYEFGKYCVRALPEVDHTIGFFISCFVRVEDKSQKNNTNKEVAQKSTPAKENKQANKGQQKSANDNKSPVSGVKRKQEVTAADNDERAAKKQKTVVNSNTTNNNTNQVKHAEKTENNAKSEDVRMSLETNDDMPSSAAVNKKKKKKKKKKTVKKSIV
jgi:putative methyltransferase